MHTIAAHSVSNDLAHIEVINSVKHDKATPGLRRHDGIASIAEVDLVKELDFSLPPCCSGGHRSRWGASA
jgi:hypothetical protein